MISIRGSSYEREGEAFLRRIITTDETWAKAYEPKLKANQMAAI
jgi:hypothetical protein